MDFFLGALAEAAPWIFQVTTKVLLLLLTLGRVKAETSLSQTEVGKAFSIYRRNGTIIVGEGYSLLFGMIFWIVFAYTLIVSLT